MFEVFKLLSGVELNTVYLCTTVLRHCNPIQQLFLNIFFKTYGWTERETGRSTYGKFFLGTIYAIGPTMDF